MKYLTVTEITDLLKLNPQTVRNWIDQGTLPAVRIGRRVRVRRTDLDRVLAEGATGVVWRNLRPSDRLKFARS
jgi:excisionase family DNA binding protein